MKEDRQKLWNEYTGAKPLYLEHPWLHYDRYRKAEPLLETIQKRGEDISKMRVLDFGCGVGDYGYVFGREGAKVYFYDKKEQIDFVVYRIANELIDGELMLVGEMNPLIQSYDFIIFGEVLEHLENPLVTLEEAVKIGAKYIYTSSYPYRSDDPNDSYWSHRGHDNFGDIRLLQVPCRDLLNQNYIPVRYEGEARLWVKKGL